MVQGVVQRQAALTTVSSRCIAGTVQGKAVKWRSGIAILESKKTLTFFAKPIDILTL